MRKYSRESKIYIYIYILIYIYIYIYIIYALKIAVLRKSFTYLEEDIPNDINKEKNKKYDHKNRKKKNYMV